MNGSEAKATRSQAKNMRQRVKVFEHDVVKGMQGQSLILISGADQGSGNLEQHV
jgi:hypothetical protein